MQLDQTKLPLFVDLDGTLIKSDALIEGVFQLLRDNLFLVLLFPLWLLRGKVFFKYQIFSRTKLDASTLPYHEEFLHFLRDQKKLGRKLVLVTASHHDMAVDVSEYLGIFDDVMGSRKVNLKGAAKARAIREYVGSQQYVYAGNAPVDLNVWQEAAAAIVVNAPQWLVTKVETRYKTEKVFPREKNALFLMLRAVRVHQWSKNILIFTPIALSHNLSKLPLIITSLLGFIAFSLVSSSVYLVNDLLDLESDRQHPDNKKRPFASGDLPLWYGFILMPLCFLAGFTTAWQLSEAFFWVLVQYFVITTVYSFHLKRIVIADILVLATLYTWRIYAGGIATHIAISAWLLTFSVFFFLSLALLKRCSELILMEAHKKSANKRRGYFIDDLPQLVSLGTSSGYISVLVFALYVNNEQGSGGLYPNPKILWAVCPFLLYWISRMWLKAHRGEMHTDPLVFALKDRVSYIMIGIGGIIWLIASGYL